MLLGIFACGKGIDTCRVNAIAKKFSVPLLETEPNTKEDSYFKFDKSGLSYVAEGLELRGDFSRLLPRVTGGRLEHEILLKAAKPEIKPGEILRAVDATAGLGEDAFLLAAKGYTVELFEHNPITAALLQDALIRGKSIPGCREIVSRMTLREGDSKELLKTLSYTPDLIYLDPMFPEKKKSSETKKKLQVLHGIESPASDEEELLQAALSVHPKKIVVKRPADGPYLAGVTPSYSIPRTAVRFDCIVGG